MSLVLPELAGLPAMRAGVSPARLGLAQRPNEAIPEAVWHSLVWLVVANCVGVLLAAMLLLPGVNTLLSPWTYGRWMPVHLNLQLYGWSSLPLVAFLFRVYQTDRLPTAAWSRPALWLWSSTLAIGSLSWLDGQTSGKLFLDWSGYSRFLFPTALLTLWAVLTYSFSKIAADKTAGMSRLGKAIRGIGLALLLIIPFLIYFAADPSIYPPINPDTGGPTGASQLESTLVIIAVLLLLPFGLSNRKAGSMWRLRAAWIVFAVEVLLCLGLGRKDVSHHRPTQWISLASLLLWIPLVPAYYAAFQWHPNTRWWRVAFLAWWALLVPTGWLLFLPGVLDRFKFTDGLVGHSLLAMGGFVSSLLIFVMAELLGDDGWIFNTRWSFLVWHTSIAAYVAVFFFAGWREGVDPAFTIMPGALRNGIYWVRLLLGVIMLAASADWLYWSSSLRRQGARVASMEVQ